MTGSCLPEGWNIANVGDLGRIVTGKTPSTSVSEYFGGDVPFVTPSDMKGQKTISRTTRYLTRKGASVVKGAFIPKGAVMVSCIGSDMGKVAIAGRDCVTNQQINSIVVTHGCVPDFIYYDLSARKAELQNLAAGGSAQPILNKGDFSKISIKLPTFSEQRAISRVLGTLDDKIDLNRRMNETLEAIAQAIFKSWFVDTTKRGLPQGWGLERLGNVADVNWGDTSVTKASYIDSGFAAYSASGADGYLPYYDFDRTGIVVSAIGANAGATWLARGKWSCIKNTIRFWATAENISTEYLFYATLGKENWPLRGSAQPFISQGDARMIQIVVPSNDLAKRFGELTEPLHSKIKANEEESRTLAELRDLLLPKLLSGEIRVKVETPEDVSA
jgi:type I restriction enzyme S subunit